MRQPAAHLRTRAAITLLCAVLLVLTAACAPAPVRFPPPVLSPAPLDPAHPSEPSALVIAERNAAAARDLATLAALWADDATLLEHRNPGQSDDYLWRGRDAILDRYVTAVFPRPPSPLQGTLDAQVEMRGGNATLQNGIDAWRFERRAGRWWITGLEIGAP